MTPQEYDDIDLDMTADDSTAGEDYLDMTDDECHEEHWRCMECGEKYSYERVSPDVDGWLIRCGRCCGGEHD